MEPQYSIEDGRYVFHLRGARRFDTAEVAVLFDAKQSVLLKHGPPERVQGYYNTMHAELMQAGQPEVAAALTLVTGRFDIEELNKVVNICDYVGQFWRNLQAAGAQATPVVA